MSLLDTKQQQQLIIILQKNRALQFGDFTTKSGKKSSYFINLGSVNSGQDLTLLTTLYAKVIAKRWGAKVTNIFGPAYKGIPLCVMVTAYLAASTTKKITFSFNRKETKDHGEGGQLIGHQYQGQEQVVIVDDILTAGTSLKQSLLTLQSYNVKILGAVVAIDRCEPAASSSAGMSAKEKIFTEFKIPVESLITSNELLT